MTREETTNYLKSSGFSEEQIKAIASAFTCDYYDCDAKTCRRSDVPKEFCEDCISRAEALKNLALTNSKDDVYRMINSLSSVQPKPKADVLDKIRAEIKEVQTYKMFEGEDTVYVERKDVLAIIDKYKAESEDKE